eukprot:1143524-Pelagomonas_calceolata.AAC.4
MSVLDKQSGQDDGKIDFDKQGGTQDKQGAVAVRYARHSCFTLPAELPVLGNLWQAAQTMILPKKQPGIGWFCQYQALIITLLARWCPMVSYLGL